MISVFEAFNWSLFDAIQPATSSMQADMLDCIIDQLTTVNKIHILECREHRGGHVAHDSRPMLRCQRCTIEIRSGREPILAVDRIA